MARKLKVFRTAAGFDDAYVAASSRKAALAAWGSDADLFARGVAEEVTDAALMAEPLAHPGEVVKRSRGTAAQQLAAVQAEKPARPRPAAKVATKATPRPDRAAIDAAEAAAAEGERRHRAAQRELEARQKALDRDKAALATAWKAEREELDREIAAAGKEYAAAMRKWRG